MEIICFYFKSLLKHVEHILFKITPIDLLSRLNVKWNNINEYKNVWDTLFKHIEQVIGALAVTRNLTQSSQARKMIAEGLRT